MDDAVWPSLWCYLVRKDQLLMVDVASAGMTEGQFLRGREDVLRVLCDILERVSRTGQSSLITLQGEAGIGKSAILGALVAQARTLGFTTGQSKAEEADLAPMAPVMQALRSGRAPILSRNDFTELLPLLQQPLLLVERLTGFIEEQALNGPVLLAIDDAQWLDDLSTYALRAMPGRLAGSPVVWLVASRPVVGGRLNDISVSAGRDIPVEHVRLGPLNEKAIEELACDRLGASPDRRVRRLLEGANGNPFLAVELLNGLSSEDVAPNRLPSSLLNAVGNRLASLPAETLRLVQTGAIIGTPFSVADAAALMNVSSETALSSAATAVRNGVLLDDGDHLSFKHDLMRAAVYEDVPPSLRKAMHRAAAQRARETGNDPLAAARHVMLVALPGERDAAQTLCDAAEALVNTAPTLAAEFVGKALELLTPSDPLWLEVGEKAVAVLARGKRSRDAISIADELLAARPTNESAARIELLVAGQLRAMGRYAEMADRIDSLSFDYVSPALRARLLGYRAMSLARDIDAAAAIAAGQRALTESTRVEDREAEALSLQALAEAARNEGRNGAALEYAEALRKLTGVISVDEIIALQLVDRFEDSKRLWSAALEAVGDHAGNSRAFELAFSALTRHYLGGSLDEAQAAGLSVIRLGEELQEQTMQYETHVFLYAIAVFRDETELALSHDQAAAAGLSDSDANRATILHLSRGLMATFAGDFAGSLEHFRNVYGPRESVRHRWRWQPQFLIAAARAGLNCGDIAFARTVAVEAQRFAELNPNVPTIAGVATHIRAIVANDLAGLEEAAEIIRHSPRNFSRGDLAVERGRLYLAAGRRADGIAALDEAWDRFMSIGAFGLARGAQRTLQAAGVRRKGWSAAAKRATSGWESLTKTERRVAQLIAEGRTNREAAAELVISLNTIATHVRSIFGKLEVASRVQLTRTVIENLT
jgi:DNA-binding CsgD family transcriptional regulator/tetratricopeptide (TPR) repeat protein